LTNSLIDARAQQLPNDKRKYFMLLNWDIYEQYIMSHIGQAHSSWSMYLQIRVSRRKSDAIQKLGSCWGNMLKPWSANLRMSSMWRQGFALENSSICKNLWIVELWIYKMRPSWFELS
jgi:hypothetical protein